MSVNSHPGYAHYIEALGQLGAEDSHPLWAMFLAGWVHGSQNGRRVYHDGKEEIGQWDQSGRFVDPSPPAEA